MSEGKSNDVSSMTKAVMARIAVRVKAFIEEFFGERCEEFDPYCACCQVWKEYDKLISEEVPDDSSDTSVPGQQHREPDQA